MNNKLNRLLKLNQSLKPPKDLSGVFLPKGSKKHFDFMFIAEMPSMNEPKNWDGKSNYNFNISGRDEFLQNMMVKYNVAGRYATDIVKKRDVPRRPTKSEMQEWLPHLLKEIEIIQPKAIIILGKRTYEWGFKPSVEPFISKKIKVEYVFHYGRRVSRNKFERKFREIIIEIRKSW